MVVIGLLLASAHPVHAQDATPLPAWLLPVVQVLDGNRVLLTTGVHLGAGRVLVPGEFAPDGVSLLVLDGGADLGQDGRPARVEQRFRLHGLALLSVSGLQRPVPVLEAQRPGPGAVLELLAMPPAAMIAAQQGSVRRRSQLADGFPLPNLTGVLTNACGHWVAHSAARGLASMAAHPNTLYQWSPDLADLLAGAGIDLPRATCTQNWPVQREEAPPAEVEPIATVPMPEVDQAPAGEAPPGQAAPEAPPEDQIEPPLPDPAEPLAPGTDEQLAPPPTAAAQPRPEPGETPGGRWLVPGLVLVLLLLAAGGLLVGRKRSNAGRARHRGPASPAGDSQPRAAGPKLLPVARLVGDHTFHPLLAKDGRVDLRLGRFDSDILLVSPAASRQHARIIGSAGALSLEDLGSGNGTFVNGHRCVPGVQVELALGDRLTFADEHYRLDGWAKAPPP